MKTDKSIFGTSASTLFKICNAAWGFCSDNLSDFTELKAIYTPEFVASALAAVQQAKDLPDSRTTIGERTTARKNLVKATDQVTANWRQLKIYIINAYDKDMTPVKLEMAGASLYQKAAYDNWNSVSQLINAANVFITNNLDALTANSNMPETFPQTFSTAGVSCSELSEFFSNMAVMKEQATGNRIEALNALYQSLMLMLRDGQHIFYNDKILRKQFVFAYLKSVYGDVRSANISGLITDASNLPVEGAVVAARDFQYIATTGSNGRYRMRMAEGTYTITVSYPGYTPVEQVVTLSAGLGIRLNFELVNAMKKVA